MRVLLVDDDVELCELLGELLRREGFEVDAAHDGRRGLEAALAGRHGLVVLDIMLPGLGGLEVLRQLRRSSAVPVLVLSARGEDVDRIVGLELGGDDYLPKPFNPRELVARLRALQRRLEPGRAAAERPLEVSGVALDPSSREVRVGGERVELTTAEFDILRLLMGSAGRVVSRAALTSHLFNRSATPFDRSIDMHVSHLRRKLGRGDLIRTVRGAGYQFCRDAGEGPAR